MSASLQIATVLGSVTPPGRLRRALTEAVDRAAGTDPDRPARFELIDLAERQIAFADGRARRAAGRGGGAGAALRGVPPLGPAPLAARF
jgi:hypothetical protein